MHLFPFLRQNLFFLVLIKLESIAEILRVRASYLISKRKTVAFFEMVMEISSQSHTFLPNIQILKLFNRR